MAVINQNNCNISNLRPLEVTCNPTNASSPEAQDGSIQLFINGGTSPYTVSWTNGSQGTYIGNLQSGTYTATVTDYYGDYTKTITCTVGNDTFYLDEFIKCEDNFNPNIYVFYDGTSMDSDTASQASESVRSWYQNKKNKGFGGILYEGVVGGENWLWWSLYPYLGSMTGGTLSDGTEIKSFGLTGDSVDNSVYNQDYCQSNDNGKCVPKNTSFNFSTTVAGGNTSDIYRRINNGFSLTGSYGSNDERSNGVPFTVTSSMTDNEDIYGDFIGGDKEYLCIIIADEAAGDGLYHGKVNQYLGTPNKEFLYTNPFEQYGDEWDVQTLKGPSNKFTHDYESFLKVWEDIKNQGGDFNGYIYPKISDDYSKIPYIQHTIATIEGNTITASEFEEKYEVDITNVGPQELNLSALTTTNVYSGLTGTTTYQNLNPTYQNGSGLKNFDWKVDPTVNSFNGGVIGNNLDEFFSGITLSNEKLYTTPIENLIDDKIYKFLDFEGCYSYNQRLLSTGQTYSTKLVSGSFDECIECQPSSGNTQFQPTLCFSDNETQYQFNPSGMTDGYFVWENTDNNLELRYNPNQNRWEITPWNNVGLGGMVRAIDETIPTGGFVNLGVTNPNNWIMSEGFCEGIPLSVTSVVSNEVCRGSANGGVIMYGEGGTEPYEFRLQNISPFPDYSITGAFSGLEPGNYYGEIRDASGNTSSTVFTIQDGEVGVNYTVSLTSNVTSNGTGTRTWGYGVQVNPSLASGLELTFDIVLTHTRIYRDGGTSTFSYSHEITKNGTLNIPYSTSPETTNTIPTECQTKPTNEITKTFTDTASSVTYSSTDTSINGVVTQTVIIDGSGLSCLPDCRMVGTYNTSLQVDNLSIDGTECSVVTNAFTPINENITIYDCQQPQP